MRLVRVLRANSAVISLGLLVAVAGAAGWVLFYVGVPLWAACVAAIVIVGVSITTLGALTAVPYSELLGWSPAFVLLTWPPLWLVVVLIRFLLTGQAIGS